MIAPIHVFVGYDPRQPVAFQVLVHSVWSKATCPVTITRLQLNQLAPFTRRGLTEFTYSRFLIPALSSYTGHSIFLDSDMLCLGDISDLMALVCANEVKRTAKVKPTKKEALPGVTFPTVWVVKNAKRFEWPSMMVFNNAACRTLTPEWVQNDANNPFDMESWASEIGALPPEWNHLVGYDTPNPKAKLIHFTQGIPCWPETQDCEFAEDWRRIAALTMGSVSFDALMGNSVHAPAVRARLAGATA